jgi:hypothetical protein
MAIPISPGVYTKIIDLSTYVQAVPGTIGFVCVISRKGPDNKLTFVGSQEELFQKFGKPNITDYGKQYGQGLYIANNHMAVSYSLYIIRPLPEDATYANLFMVADSTNMQVTVESLASQNTLLELDTNVITAAGFLTPICYFIPKGRGDAYEDLGIRITEHANDQVEDVYILDVYETQFDGDDSIIETFEVSFDDTMLDESGESIFIEDVLEKYSLVLNCKVNDAGVDIVTVNSLDYTEPFSATEAIHLDEGSEGSLVVVDPDTGKARIDSTTADQILSQAYTGIIDDDVVDLDNIYFTLVWDPGYPTSVKVAINTLVDIYRRDCVAIMDNGDNTSYLTAMASRADDHNFNSRYVALYESYSKVYDMFTGRDIWVTPVYHMATLIPLNDKLYDLWYPSAGFNRATIASIKELRFNPKLGQRDNMYLAQLNPIVKFNVGYTVWGQLTSQKRPSKLQDLHAIRTVLYIKRALEQYLKFFIFEFNDEETWSQIASDITPFLGYIKAARGLSSYNVDVGATGYELKAKICHCNVILEPTPIIEKIMLNLYVK